MSRARGGPRSDACGPAPSFYAAPMRPALLVLALALAALPAAADEPRAPKMPKPAAEPHPASFGARDRACLEWTDACQICARDAAGGEPRCSTPGIACTPARVSCTRR